MAKLLQVLVDHAVWLRRGVYVLLAGLVIADILLPSAYDRFPWESIGGFGAFYGFVGCILIIALAKGLGHALLYKPEDYYDE